MTPVYASRRAKIGGWYAYQYPASHFRRVFWDGGVGKRQLGATGFWCPYTGNIVDVPDRLLRDMPNVCIDGFTDGHEVLVTGLPKVEDFIGVVGEAFTDETDYLYNEPGMRGNFADEIHRGDELLGEGPCRMVPVEQLPDDDHAALDYFREHYPYGAARHPLSPWSPYRSARLVANIQTQPTYEGRVREIHHVDGMNLIDFVTVWATVEKELKVIPLYEGDAEADCPFWKIKNNITLYCVEDLVIGYE